MMKFKFSILQILLTVCSVQAYQERCLTTEEIESLRPILGQKIENKLSIPKDYFSIEEVDVYPRQITQNEPSIPGSGGRSVAVKMDILLLINEEGKIEEVSVLDAPFEKIALECKNKIQEWRFSPAELDGIPVKCFVKIAPMVYKIDIEKYKNQNKAGMATSGSSAPSRTIP